MAFRFRLEPLLNLRERKREKIQIQLANKTKEHTKLLEELAEIKKQKEDLQILFSSRIKGGITSNELSIFLDEIEYINRLENEKIRKINFVEKEISQIKRKLMDAHKEVKLLEILKDREREKYNREETKNEQKQIDEIINTRYANQI